MTHREPEATWDEVGNYAEGRPAQRLREPYQAADRTFASERIDDRSISQADYKHCTFINMSFKKSRIERASFEDCIFIGCYFRRAELKDCSFVGCRFVDCRFPYVSIRSCDFRYASFKGCSLPSKEILYSLPSEPNLREDLARNLRIEAARLGLSNEAGRYRDIEIRAMEGHLWAAVVGESTWYKEHFDAAARVRSFFVYVTSLLNRWMWGYGERLLVLLRNWAFASFILFPALYWALGAQFQSPTDVNVAAALIFSLKNAVPAAIGSNIVAVGGLLTAISIIESVYSAVTLALVASYVFRWSLHR
jgi:hypothetical protein